jgi:hypothetical protein
MIQPLRTYHRRMFLVLAVALPAVFLAGLVARRKPTRTVSSVSRSVLVAGTDWRKHFFVVLATHGPNGVRFASLVPTKPSIVPDGLVYFSDSAPHGDSLPEQATLLGRFEIGTSYPASSPGFLILYSPAQRAVIDFAPLGGGL